MFCEFVNCFSFRDLLSVLVTNSKVPYVNQCNQVTLNSSRSSL